MTTAGRVVFSKMDEVTFGTPAVQAVADLVRRAKPERVFLMVSGTLNRETEAIARIRAALGNTCAAVFDRMLPHTPRKAVIEATEAARSAGADLILTVGGGSVTDAAKAVQLCLANDIRSADALDALRAVKAPDGTMGPAAMQPSRGAPDRRPNDAIGRGIQCDCRRDG